MLPDFGRLSVEEGEAVGDRSAVQVDELGDTLGDPVGCARDNDPRVAVPEEKDVAEVLELDDVNDVGYVSLQVHFGASEVRPFAETGEGEGVGVVALVSELAGYWFPTPAPQPGAPDQHVRSHPKDLPWRALSGSNDSTLAGSVVVVRRWGHKVGRRLFSHLRRETV